MRLIAIRDHRNFPHFDISSYKFGSWFIYLEMCAKFRTIAIRDQMIAIRDRAIANRDRKHMCHSSDPGVDTL